MCIAIYKPANEVITEEALRNCYEANGDGCGFAYINTDNMGVKRIIVKKTMEWDTFLRQYNRAIRTSPESDFLIHFRIRTHGVTSTFNCHPFKVDEDTVFIHNGIISGVGYHAQKSDTQMFNEEILQVLPKGFMFNAAITSLIEDTIGHSKLVVMDIDSNVTIYNPQKGQWDGKIWYSNASYKASAWRTRTTTHTYSHLNGQRGRGTTNVTYLNRGASGVLTDTSYRPCQHCKKWSSPISKMRFFYSSDEVFAYCPICASKYDAMSFTNPEAREVSLKCFKDYFREVSTIGKDNFQVFFQKWNNPWAMFDNDQPSQEDLDEYYGGMYGGISKEQ